MKLVACVIAQAIGEPVKFRLKDADTGIVYPNLLTNEQICSPSVQRAARTYIGTQIRDKALCLSALPPLVVSLCDHVGWSGSRTGRDSSKEPANTPVPESIAPAGFTSALIDEINQLKRAVAGLQERNDRQARIIKVVQGAVQGAVQ